MGYYDELDAEIDHEMGWSKPGERNKGSPRRSPDHWHALLRTAAVTSPIWRLIRAVFVGIAKVVFFPIISPMSYTKHFNVDGDMIVVKRSFFWRVLDGILTRILLTPVLLAVFLIAIVHASTHPRMVQAIATPESLGLYFKRVSLMTVDSQRLTAWYIPPISADAVAYDTESTLIQEWPAVVLCHGLGASQEQYLPLARELHDGGFAVLMVDMRGQGESDKAAVTYGLRERFDVLAGVKFLRETIHINKSKVCVVGHDIGAMAALQAATLDTSIRAVVADGLWPRFEERAREIFSRPQSGHFGQGTRLPTQWMAPLYTLAFEISIRDRLGQLDPESVVRNIRSQPVLFIARHGSNYAPVQDVLTLATNAGARHEVFVADSGPQGDTERRIHEFLINATQWKGPDARGAEQIERMLRSQVQP